MPNGWYPVPGLEVMLFNRTEHSYPELQWRQGYNEFEAYLLDSFRGYGVFEEVRSAEYDSDGIEGIRTVLLEVLKKAETREKELGMMSSSGHGIHISFEKKRGKAIGSWFVYGLCEKECVLLHGGGLKPDTFERITNELCLDNVGHMLRGAFVGTERVYADPNMRTYPSYDPIREDEHEFSFEEYEQLIISSYPLHIDSHWPPRSLIDASCIMMARVRQQDELLAVWKSKDAKQDERT